jgi:hypothetical protein
MFLETKLVYKISIQCICQQEEHHTLTNFTIMFKQSYRIAYSYQINGGGGGGVTGHQPPETKPFIILFQRQWPFHRGSSSWRYFHHRCHRSGAIAIKFLSSNIHDW